jgi:hypothetical protein
VIIWAVMRCGTLMPLVLRGRAFKLSPVVSASRNAQRAADSNEAERRRRLREDAQRPLSVNLAEGIALSHKLMSFVGTARKT